MQPYNDAKVIHFPLKLGGFIHSCLDGIGEVYNCELAS